MSYSNSVLKEGILITILGLVGIIRVIQTFPEAGPMITIMLYTLLPIFFVIAIIGIRIIIDEINSMKKKTHN